MDVCRRYLHFILCADMKQPRSKASSSEAASGPSSDEGELATLPTPSSVPSQVTDSHVYIEYAKRARRDLNNRATSYDCRECIYLLGALFYRKNQGNPEDQLLKEALDAFLDRAKKIYSELERAWEARTLGSLMNSGLSHVTLPYFSLSALPYYIFCLAYALRGDFPRACKGINARITT
jgi:hypothetical protein